MLKVWGNADSVNVQKVLWCCEEIGLAHERIDAARHFGVVDTPAFRALNPNGLVPTIDDDGFVLWESHAIVRYLAARHAPDALWPADVQERARGDRWMDWSQSTLWPALLPLFRAFFRTPAERRDAAAIDRDRREAIEVLAILDAALADAPYAAGGRFGVGDIALGCPAWRWFAMPLDRPRFANLERWHDRLAQRPAYRRTVMLPLTG